MTGDSEIPYQYIFTATDGNEKGAWLLPQTWLTDSKFSFTIQYDPQQKNYAIVSGLFKGGHIVEYEQGGRRVTSAFSANVNITGLSIRYQNQTIWITTTGVPLEEEGYADGVADGIADGVADGVSNGIADGIADGES